MNPKLLSLEEVKQIAALARVGLSDAEAVSARRDLANIFSHFAQLQKVETAAVPTADDITGLKNIARADQAESGGLCAVDSLLQAAPQARGRHIKVRAVFS